MKSDKLTFKKIEIIDVGSKGNSICKNSEGKVIIVKNGVPGDIIDVKTYKKRKKFFLGKIEKFHKYSDKRVQPKCTHFGVCGGCKWQNISYDEQVKFKENKIKHLFNDYNLDNKVNKIIKSDNQFYYRNKVEFSFTHNRWLTEDEIKGDKSIKDKRGVGFHLSGMWNKVVDIQECFLQSDPSNKIRTYLKSFAIKNEISFYNPKLNRGSLRTMMIRNNSKGEFMVIIQFCTNDKTTINLVMDFLKNSFTEIKSLGYIINKKLNDSIYDQDVVIFSGREYIEEKISNLKFRIYPKSFFQTNIDQTIKLYKVVKKFANLNGNELVYDLYCGLGTISQFIAHDSKKVIGIESVNDAVISAKDSSNLNNIKNIEFIVGDMRNILDDELFTKYGKPDLVITDPPRDGMHKSVVFQLLKIMPKQIIYVSCNPSTQKRDLDLLLDKYKIKIIQPIDMFPHTDHVENVVLLKLKI